MLFPRPLGKCALTLGLRSWRYDSLSRVSKGTAKGRFETRWKHSSPWSRVSSKIVHDPESALAKRMQTRVVCEASFLSALEQELCEASAGALGRQQRVLDKAYEALTMYREKHGKSWRQLPSAEQKQVKTTHNQLRADAMRQRESLMIQRQACGFRLKNYEILRAAFPIPPEWR